ncbi:unnamed protein product [Mortierella alpina]
MEPIIAPSNGRRALVGYRWGLAGLAVIMLALDCVTIGLFDSLMNPRYKYFSGFDVFSGDFTILVVPDVLTIICFALLAFRPQGFAPLKRLSSRVLTGCRVFFSLGLTALVLYGPAMELTAMMDFKSMLDNDPEFHDDPASAHEGFVGFVYCLSYPRPDTGMAQSVVMLAKLPPSKGSRILIAYRYSLIVLAIVMLALDCATIGLYESGIKPNLFYFGGLLKEELGYALLLLADLFAIVFFALLIIRPRGFTLFENLSSRVLTSCRVFLSLGLTVLVLYEPAMESESLMLLKSSIFERGLKPDEAHAAYMDFFLCKRKSLLEPDMAQMFQQYCQVARARWFLGFFLAALMLGELELSYWERDFKVQQERDRDLQTGTGEYKTMSVVEA